MWEYNYTNELYHHGILGMKWGVRRYQRKDGTLTPAGKKRAAKMEKNYQELTGKNLKRVNSAAKARAAKAAKTTNSNKTKSLSEMSDEELRAAINRLQMEQQYKNLNPKKVSAGEKFMKAAVDVAGKAAKDAATDAATKYLKKTLSKALGVDEKDPDEAFKALEKEAKYWENKKKIDQGKEYFANKEKNKS